MSKKVKKSKFRNGDKVYSDTYDDYVTLEIILHRWNFANGYYEYYVIPDDDNYQPAWYIEDNLHLCSEDKDECKLQ